MVVNKFFACDMCDAKYRIRWEVGENDAELFFNCPECGAEINAKPMSLDYKKEMVLNAHQIPEQKCDYVVELSTDFLVNKIHKVGDERYDDSATPFLRAVFGDEKQMRRFSEILYFSRNIAKYKNEINTIASLFRNKSFSSLRKKLKEEDNPYINKCRACISPYTFSSGVDYLIGAHHYSVFLLECILGEEYVSQASEYIKAILDCFLNGEFEEMRQFIVTLGDQSVYENLDKKYSIICNDFFEQYRALVPIITDRIFTKPSDPTQAITTVNVNLLLSLYKKCYEFIGEFALIVIGLNNIHTRGALNSFKNGEHDFLEYLSKIKSKFNKVTQGIMSDEFFSKPFNNCLNNVIRNSEAHFSYEMDPMTQLITFKDENKIEEHYLVDFAKMTIDIFYSTTILWELSYQLYKIYRTIILGERPTYGRKTASLGGKYYGTK